MSDNGRKLKVTKIDPRKKRKRKKLSLNDFAEAIFNVGPKNDKKED